MTPKYKSMSSLSAQLKKQKSAPTLERKRTLGFAKKQYVCLH